MSFKTISNFLQKFIFLAVLINTSSCFGSETKPQTEENNIKNSLEQKGPITTSDFDLKDFDEINIGKGVKVEITRGTGYTVQLIGAANETRDLSLVVENNVLKLKYVGEMDKFKPHYQATVKITMPQLRKVNLNGATVSTLSGFSSLPKLYINLSGKSTLTVQNFSAEYAWVNVSGDSELYGYNLVAKTADVNVSASSKCEITVSDILNGNVSSRAELTYKGNPQENITLSNLGKASKLK